MSSLHGSEYDLLRKACRNGSVLVKRSSKAAQHLAVAGLLEFVKVWTVNKRSPWGTHRVSEQDEYRVTDAGRERSRVKEVSR